MSKKVGSRGLAWWGPKGTIRAGGLSPDRSFIDRDWDTAGQDGIEQ